MEKNEPVDSARADSEGDRKDADRGGKNEQGPLAKTIQLLSIVVGLVISVLSFNAARQAEAYARQAEAEKRRAEAAAPFLALRQQSYLEAVKTAAVLANPEDHTADEIKQAKKRFRELYVAELSLVEGIDVERSMVKLARAVDPGLETMTDAQRAAYGLAHALRNSLVRSWNVDEQLVDNND